LPNPGIGEEEEEKKSTKSKSKRFDYIVINIMCSFKKSTECPKRLDPIPL
jgi:hypothetical protein